MMDGSCLNSSMVKMYILSPPGSSNIGKDGMSGFGLDKLDDLATGLGEDFLGAVVESLGGCFDAQ